MEKKSLTLRSRLAISKLPGWLQQRNGWLDAMMDDKN